MKRNFLLILAVLVSLILAVNSTNKILTFRTNAQKVKEVQLRLEKLRQENEALKKELEYKKSDKFAEEEIRNKLGLAKEGEAVVIVPETDESHSSLEFLTKGQSSSGRNWQKWRSLFFGS